MDANSNDSQPMSVGSILSIPKHNHPSKPYRNECSENGFRSIEEIPPIYRHIFQYPYFNKMQSQVMDDVLYSDKSVVVSAPTGSGKTVIFELAIVRLMMQMNNSNYKDDFKIIYMAPTKALCTERLMDWYGKFIKLGLTSIEVTGDSDTLDFNQLKAHRIIMTTPEKWDSLTRRWKDNKQMVEMVKLFIMDEVHLLNEDVRGPVLEVVVSRMKTIQEVIHTTYSKDGDITMKEEQGTNIRFLAASATIPNAEDIAAWLQTKYKPAVCFNLGEEYRSVKLVKIVEGYPCRDGQSLFKFDIFLNYRVKTVMEKYCGGKPTLIFCNTRKSVMLTAETLSKELLFHFTNGQATKFTEMAARLSEKKLQKLAMSGIGCHHAGFLHSDRNIIEQMFRAGNLPVLITTSTLAMGVNLPAHLVIIKTTQHYVNGAYTEYEESTILQMMGRAGRPQFDVEGVAVIMTRNQDRMRYEQLCGGQRAVESKLHRHLAEHLNAEVALGTIGDLLLAMDWLRSTFLYVRATRNPSHYGCNKLADRESIEKRLQEICVKWMNALTRAGLLVMDGDTQVTSTEAGVLMATYCLDLDTMKLILKIKGNESLSDLLNMISECHEFEDIALRANEKRCLNQLNKNSRTPSSRFPLPGKIQTKHMKANCLIQAVFGSLPILDPSLNQESVKIIRLGENIVKCIVAYLTRSSYLHTEKKIFKVILNSTILAKCFAAKMWDNSEYLCRQLNGIGPAYASALATAGKTSFEAIKQSNPRDLERIINRGPPAGNVLKKQVSLLPIYGISLETASYRMISVNVCVKNAEELLASDVTTTGNKHKTILIVGSSENELLYYDCIMDVNLLSLPSAKITRRFYLRNNLSQNITIFAHLISHSWVGLDVHTDMCVRKMHVQDRDIFSTVDTIQSSQEDNNGVKNFKTKLSKLNSNKPNQDKNKLNQSTAKRRRDPVDSLYAQEVNSSPKVLKTIEMPSESAGNLPNKDFQSAYDSMDFNMWKKMIQKDSSSQINATTSVNEIKESYEIPREQNISEAVNGIKESYGYPRDQNIAEALNRIKESYGYPREQNIAEAVNGFKESYGYPQDQNIAEDVNGFKESYEIPREQNIAEAVNGIKESNGYPREQNISEAVNGIKESYGYPRDQNIAEDINGFKESYEYPRDQNIAEAVNGIKESNGYPREQNISEAVNGIKESYGYPREQNIAENRIAVNNFPDFTLGCYEDVEFNNEEVSGQSKLHEKIDGKIDEYVDMLTPSDSDIDNAEFGNEEIIQNQCNDENSEIPNEKVDARVPSQNEQNNFDELHEKNQSVTRMDEVDCNENCISEKLNIVNDCDDDFMLNDDNYWNGETNPFDFVNTNQEKHIEEVPRKEIELYNSNVQLNLLDPNEEKLTHIKAVIKNRFNKTINLELNYSKRSDSWIFNEIKEPLFPDTNVFQPNKNIKCVTWKNPLVSTPTNTTKEATQIVLNIKEKPSEDVITIPNVEIKAVDSKQCSSERIDHVNQGLNKHTDIVFECLKAAFKNQTREEVLEKHNYLMNWIRVSPFEDSVHVEDAAVEKTPDNSQFKSEISSILKKYQLKHKDMTQIGINSVDETGSMDGNFEDISEQVRTEPSPEIDTNHLLTNQNQSNPSAADILSFDDYLSNMYRDKPDYSINYPMEDDHLESNVKVSDHVCSDEYNFQGFKSNLATQNYPWLSQSSFKASPNFGKSHLSSVFKPTSSSQLFYKPSRSEEMFFKSKFVDRGNAPVFSEFRSQNINARPHGPVLNNFTGKIDVRSKLKIDALKEFENTPKRKYLLSQFRAFGGFITDIRHYNIACGQVFNLGSTGISNNITCS
ncbi:uncharacterized protein LOC143912681 [Arctopsyche grandis]|uniref:uncharacterized protein LOC143912681 n=1 Tax=Arctopsyche grandis TaxID=121162 RepID=UPI00406D9629